MQPADTPATVPATRTRQQPDDRRNAILQAAVQYATTYGFTNLTREEVAKAASVSPALISHYFLHTDLLRDAVMQAAVEQEVLSIIVIGVALQHPIAVGAPVELRQKAINSI